MRTLRRPACRDWRRRRRASLRCRASLRGAWANSRGLQERCDDRRYPRIVVLPHGDDLYLGVAVALVVAGAVVATVFLRRFGRLSRGRCAAVAAAVGLVMVLVLEPRRAVGIAAP